MKYKEYKISSPENNIVKSVYWLEMDKISEPMPFIPDGNPELMITSIPVHVSSLSKSHIISGISLFWGQIGFSGFISCSKPYKMFGIKFQPWALRLITKPHQPLPVNLIIAAEQIIPASTIGHATDLLKFYPTNETFRTLETDLTEHCINNIYRNPSIKENLKKAITTIREDPSLRISNLLPSYKQSWKSLENHFQKYIGLRPKEYQKIIRLRKTCEKIRGGEKFVNAALSSGYYDQAHFNKEFSRATHQSPSNFSWQENLVLSSL